MSYEAPAGIVSSSLPLTQLSARVDRAERGAALREKAKVLRAEFLAARRDWGVTPSNRSWGALPLIAVGAQCPNCRSALLPVPPRTGVLLACPDCGFVAKRDLSGARRA